MIVDNAIIMAAGTSSRFAPLSYENHKAMTVVRGEVLIERQIRQLKEAGIPRIYIVTGYKKEQFDYLAGEFDVCLIHNPDYMKRNNNGSIWVAREVLGNSYICSSDNYFTINPFEREVDESYYAAEYCDGYTDEWCLSEDSDGYIGSVTIGGEHSWYMLGHTFWSSAFSASFLSILEREYKEEDTAGKLWESILVEHLDILKMRVRRYAPGVIHEFDTLDELRKFDPSYIADTRSSLLKKAAGAIGVTEDKIVNIHAIKGSAAAAVGFDFDCDGKHYRYDYSSDRLDIERR